MKRLLKISWFTCLCLMTASLALAKDPTRTPRGNSNGRSTRPEVGADRVTGQGNPRASSPAPGKSRIADRSRPERQDFNSRAVGPDRPKKGNGGDSPRGNAYGHQEDRIKGNPNGSGDPNKGPRNAGFESPRHAAERGLRKRLSQIDKLRDKALDTGNLDLLDVADRMELDARRKTALMIERLDQREAQGKPGVGPQTVRPNGKNPNENARFALQQLGSGGQVEPAVDSAQPEIRPLPKE